MRKQGFYCFKIEKKKQIFQIFLLKLYFTFLLAYVEYDFIWDKNTKHFEMFFKKILIKKYEKFIKTHNNFMLHFLTLQWKYVNAFFFKIHVSNKSQFLNK